MKYRHVAFVPLPQNHLSCSRGSGTTLLNHKLLQGRISHLVIPFVFPNPAFSINMTLEVVFFNLMWLYRTSEAYCWSPLHNKILISEAKNFFGGMLLITKHASPKIMKPPEMYAKYSSCYTFYTSTILWRSWNTFSLSTSSYIMELMWVPFLPNTCIATKPCRQIPG